MIQPTGAPVTVIGFYKYSTRWGAAPHTPLSTNMHPGWGGEDFFTPSEVVGIASHRFQASNEVISITFL